MMIVKTKIYTASQEHDRFDEIIDLLKQGNIYGEKENITLGAVDVPIEKQISIDKVSTKGLKSEEYINDSESKLDKLRKLRRLQLNQ